MKTTTLELLTGGADWIGLGVAGNQAEHLEQAGEVDDFLQVDAPENAPKGIFPWYVPQSLDFLGVNPLSHDTLAHNGELRLQPEPEIALIVKLNYGDNSTSLVLESIETIGFSVFNDCSRREKEAKISLKKNWGPSSQGIAQKLITLDDFGTPGGGIDQFRITCHLERDGKLHAYGQDTALSDYCYFNSILEEWITTQINHQRDHGPLEDIGAMLAVTEPRFAVISIGATCYSAFGNSEERFLIPGDIIHVTAYNSSVHDGRTIEHSVLSGAIDVEGTTMVHLRQLVVLPTS